MAIWVVFALMTGAAVFALLWPLSRRPHPAAPDGSAEAVLATETGFYEDQLRDIERDAARGLLAPQEAEAARAEAARRLLRASRLTEGAATPRVGEPALRHRRAASAFALSTVPLLALLIYGLYGSPDLPAQPQAQRLAAARKDAGDLSAAVTRIEAHLAREPNDGRGWEVLAPVYLRAGRLDDAVKAYETALRLLGETAPRLSDYGEALVAAGDGMVSDKARGAFERALALDGEAVKPRFYLARAAEQDGKRDLALERYTALAAASPPDAPWLPVLRDSIQRLGGRAPAQTPAQAQAPALSEEQRTAIRGMIASLDQRLSETGGTPDEWARLVRSYGVMGERDKAEDALRRARAALADKAAPVDAAARDLGLTAAPASP